MQPYFFPYIGYFQLVYSTDKFVFYDDVNFIKGGWINRNRILDSGKPEYITINCKSISSFKTIRSTEYELNEKQFKTLLRKLEMNYAKAPYKNEVMEIVLQVLGEKMDSIADLAAASVISVCKYLGIEREFKFSSEYHNDSKGKDKLERLLDICHKENSSSYINPIGGMEIYDKESFKGRGIELFFIETKKIVYKQFGDYFFPNLSIIDVLMHNSKEYIVGELIGKYELK
jgi:hypothetical protein